MHDTLPGMDDPRAQHAPAADEGGAPREDKAMTVTQTALHRWHETAARGAAELIGRLTAQRRWPGAGLTSPLSSSAGQAVAEGHLGRRSSRPPRRCRPTRLIRR